MAKTKQETQELQESAQRIFLAGLGALSKAEKEGSKTFKKLVKRGKKYDGPGADEAAAIRGQLEAQLDGLRKGAAEVQREADRQATKAKQVVEGQVGRAMQGLDGLVEGIEGRIEQAVTAALHGLGVPTRDEITELRASVRQLSKNLDAARQQREIARAAVPDVEALAVGGGWYEVRVHGLVVDKVQGEDDAAARVEELRAQDFSTGRTEAQTVTTEATGGGWYAVKVDGVVVDKVQGQKAADAAVARLEKQAA